MGKPSRVGALRPAAAMADDPSVGEPVDRHITTLET